MSALQQALMQPCMDVHVCHYVHVLQVCACSFPSAHTPHVYVLYEGASIAPHVYVLYEGAGASESTDAPSYNTRFWRLASKF